MLRKLKIEELHLITQKLLDIKSQKKDDRIFEIYTFLFPDEKLSSKNKAFFKLIKIFHPDRIEFHNNLLEKSSNDISQFYTNLFSLLDELENIKVKDHFVEVEINYSYDIEDFDDVVDINSYYDDYEDENIIETTTDFDLIDAFRSTFIENNNNAIITPSMISMTTGYVDFSNLGINNTKGIEYYIYIERLNLNNNELDNLNGIENIHQLKELYISNNNIDDIVNIENLKHLEILDISNNDIYDITVLLKINSLKYVNIRNNHLRDNKIKKELERKGIIVID